MGVQEKA
jgi:hypothetical protein